MKKAFLHLAMSMATGRGQSWCEVGSLGSCRCGGPVCGGHPAKATGVVTCQYCKQVQAAKGSEEEEAPCVEQTPHTSVRLHPWVGRGGGPDRARRARPKSLTGLCTPLWTGRTSVKLCNWRLSWIFEILSAGLRGPPLILSRLLNLIEPWF